MYLPAYDVQDSFATLYVGHHCSHTHLHGHLYCDKLQMENQHPCSSSGMMVGGLLSYSLIFNFNPVSWLCFFILLSGMLGTARIIVKQHTLLEVLAGFIVGLFCGVIGILFI